MNRLFSLVALSLIVIVVAIGLGSVYVPATEVVRILLLGQSENPTLISIIQNIRLPRVLMAYVAGAGLSLSGVVMQSVLKNPLASSFTIGTSTGAAVGASFAILSGITIFGFLTIPIFGFTFAVLTVVLAISISAKFSSLENTTIILIGMAISFLGSALLTILMAVFSESMQRLLFWQMGSVSGVPLTYVAFIFGMTLLCLFFLLLKHKELDILTLDDDTARTMGVDVKRTKWVLLMICAILTGTIVSFVGIIGFVDLFTPPLARKFIGSRHRYVLLATPLMGGSFMVLSDLLARVVLSPIELPIGAVTALIGGPLFIYIYLKGFAHARS